MDEYKSLNKYLRKKNNNSEDNTRDFDGLIRSFLSKVLISLIIFVSFLIGVKKFSNFKETVYDNVYSKSFSFAYINNWYKTKFGDVFPLENLFPKDVEVFSEKLSYESANVYKDGVALKVSSSYLVPLIDDGIVIFLGNKDDYGKTMIIQQENGIDVWYCNINFSDIDMYDYLNKGSFIGEAEGDTIYMLFQKDGEFLDYKDYI